MWSEGENYDLALSFQEKAGCDEIWEKICQVRIVSCAAVIVTVKYNIIFRGFTNLVFRTCYLVKN